jgi:hypothetical protein
LNAAHCLPRRRAFLNEFNLCATFAKKREALGFASNIEKQMSVQLEIIRAAEFIRFGPKGEFDLVASCAALHGLAEACKRRGMNRALLDGRNARAELSPNELAALVNAFVEIGFTRDLHLAILHPAERYQRARLFAFISRIKGWNVRAFGDFEQAMYWLSSDQIRQQPKPVSAHRKQVSVSHDGGETKSIPIKRSHHAPEPRRPSEHLVRT